MSFESYIKPQLKDASTYLFFCCISFDSYIKPQHSHSTHRHSHCCISFDSYIKPQLNVTHIKDVSVVYLLIPTSNHNYHEAFLSKKPLYIF